MLKINQNIVDDLVEKIESRNNKVSSWSPTTTDAHYPSEKLVKNSLDGKANSNHSHDERYYTESEINNLLSSKQDTLVSGSDIKTINSQSILGSGNISISTDITIDDQLSSQSTNPVENRVINAALTYKSPTYHASETNSYGLGSTSNYGHVKTIDDLTQLAHENGTALAAHQGYVLKNLIDAKSDFSGNYNDLTNKPSTFLPSAHNQASSTITESSALPHLELDANANQHAINLAIDSKIGAGGSSGTAIACVSDFSLDQSDDDNIKLYVDACQGKVIDRISKSSSGLVDTYTIYFDNNDTYVFTVTNGRDGTITIDSSISSTSENAVMNKVIYSALQNKANSTHTHTKSEITDFAHTHSISDISNLQTSLNGKANTSHTHSESDITNLGDYIEKSSTSGLVKNDGTIDTNTYLTQHQDISGKVNTSDIVNNLTTTASGKALDARQGKVLADLIGDAITYINQ